jgi:hypothetical protein
MAFGVRGGGRARAHAKSEGSSAETAFSFFGKVDEKYSYFESDGLFQGLEV